MSCVSVCSTVTQDFWTAIDSVPIKMDNAAHTPSPDHRPGFGGFLFLIDVGHPIAKHHFVDLALSLI